MHIIMTVYGNEYLTLKERLLFLRKFYPGRYHGNGRNLGWLMKFNNAIGFAKVEDQPCGKGSEFWHVFKPASIETGKNYKSPYALLLVNSYFLNKPDEIVTFAIENTRIYCKDKKYSYNTMEMMIRFQNFLYKILGANIRIEFSIEKEFNLSQRDWLLSQFLTCLAQSEICDNECAVGHATKKKDIDYIIDVFKSLGMKDLEFIQFYCETCAGYNPKAPYHTELDFDSHFNLDEKEEDYLC